MGRFSPTITIDPAEAAEHPRVTDRWAFSADGYCESVQATRMGLPSEMAADLSALAARLLAEYCRNIGELSCFSKGPARFLPPVHCEEKSDGSVRFKSLGLTVIDMGPVVASPPHTPPFEHHSLTPEPASPGEGTGEQRASRSTPPFCTPQSWGESSESFAAFRIVRGGLMVARGEEGRAILAVRITPLKDTGSDAKRVTHLIELRLEDYRPALRGTAEKAPIREKLYKQTQLVLHEEVGKKFLGKLAL